MCDKQTELQVAVDFYVWQSPCDSCLAQGNDKMDILNYILI